MHQVTFNLNADDGSVYADAAAWVTAFGPCGTENQEFVTEGTMTVLDGGNGVTIVLKYADEATATAHAATVNGIVGTTCSNVVEATV